ncbi:helix-turn-helix transcriptional regulator [Phytoactinopolyspora limicola]|uniref:helix-turn-helix transcriptional regulator n=1 Tax=Phytoactinopolyspora limicola TaxID=2715536 RepID=UPI00140C893A|nr:helix-turn-helix transcriptional regulator [Phytoactinopolyspora limicola]
MADEPRPAFARVVVDARTRRGWTQEDLALASGIGERTISRWEKRGAEPRIGQIRAFIDATNAAPEDILRALDLLPAEPTSRISDDPDEQAIWSLGERRGWPEDLRRDLIDFLRVRRQRYSDGQSSDQEGGRTARPGERLDALLEARQAQAAAAEARIDAEPGDEQHAPPVSS